jgi:hypothetical protein
MLNKAAKLTLVATSLAPICLTLWFVEFSKAWDNKLTIFQNMVANWQVGWGYLVATVLMSLLCFLLVWLSGRNLEKLPVKIKAVKTVDKEIVGFLLVYLLPLMNTSVNQTNNPISLSVLVFIAVIFFFIIQNSHAYHFNPLLGFFGYHFYEVTIEGDITYVLITRQHIADCKSISQVVQLTEYMILEPTHAKK